MSWLFGLNQKPQDFSQFLPPPGVAGADGAAGGQGGPGGPNDKPPNKNSSMEAYRFDSAALERAATAAKELEKSRKFPVSVLCSNRFC